MRYLALDIGDERIGVAVSDEEGQLARPLTIIARRAGPSSFRRLAQMIAELGIGTLVVGLPLREDGTPGKQVRSTEAYVSGLRQHVSIPIVFHDERNTTAAARSLMGKRARRRGHLDDVAAAIILQDYLDDQGA